MLPSKLEQAVRIASVPEPLRRFVRRVGAFAVEVRLPPGADAPRAIVELLKLRDLEPEAVDVNLTTHDGPALTWIERRGATGVLGSVVQFEALAAELDGPLDLLLRSAMRVLATPEELLEIALQAETELAARAALSAVVEEMLSAERHEQALAIFLAGVTAGASLGFHRAAVFTKDAAKGTWVGQLGVGPADEADAHRIWESVEAESVTFRQQLDRVSTATPFCQRVTQIALAAEGANEVALALSGKRAVFERKSGAGASELSALDPAATFVLMRITARGHVLGLLFADLRFAADPHVAPERLEALRIFVDHAGLVWETRNLIRRVEELARHDPLTTLLNRRAFEERYSEERMRAQRTKTPIALLLIDLDHFREVNNERGHAAGDATLRALGALLKSELRALDVAARFGGDEIVVLLPGAGALEAALVARRLGVAAHRRDISLSIGAAAFPEDTDHPDDLLGIADKNLYAAKAAGRGRASLSSNTAPLVFAEETEDAAP